MNKLTVVLPTYNESKNIQLVVPRIVEVLSQCQATFDLDFEVMVVDDNSPDGTWKIAEELSRSIPQLRVIRRLHGRGLSSAVMAGFAASTADFLLVMDADLQHDEGALKGFVDAFLKGADIVVGSRKVEGGGIENWNRSRRFVSWTATQLANFAIAQSVSDPMSGFFGVRREFYNEIAADINPRGFKILLEFLARSSGKKIAEVGYVFRDRLHGESKLSSRIIFEYLEALYDLRFGRVVPARFLKYALVGLSGVVVNQCGVFLARSLFQAPDEAALAAGIEISIVSNFVLNNFWTFRQTRLRGNLKILRGFLTFNTICLAGAVINYAVALTLSHQLAISLYAANFVGILLATCWNYFVNSNVTWTNRALE